MVDCAVSYLVSTKIQTEDIVVLTNIQTEDIVVSTNIQTEDIVKTKECIKKSTTPRSHSNTNTKHTKIVSLKKKNTAEKKPHNRLRYDQISHFPAVDTNRNGTRCKNENCTQKTHFLCTKCNVHLCLKSDRNCYKDFHILYE